MRIVNRAEFISMPAGTVFAKYEPCFFEHLQIKGESIIFENGDDYMYQDIVDATNHIGTADMYDVEYTQGSHIDNRRACIRAALTAAIGEK